MALSNALSTALSGLRFTSLSTTLTGSNIANAGNAAYIKKRLQPSTTSVVDALSGVQPGNITREYDSFVQRQLQGERANSGYADTRATFLTRVDQLFGVPGSSGSLDSVLNDFSGSLQQLAASSDSYTARSDVVSKATVLAQSIRSLSQSVQNMRVDAEKGLSDAVTKVGSILNDLANVNTRLRGSPSNSDDRVSFLDQRDQLIADLSSYVDIRTSFDKNDNVQIITSTGYSLLAPQPPTLSFDARSQLSANNVYSSDPTKRSVGTITSVSGGSTADLIAIGAFRSGKIGALIELRDKTLPATQAQLDEVAAGLAQALGTQPSSTAVTVAGPGPTQGFDLSTPAGGLKDGDTVTMTLIANGQSQRFTFKRVDDTGATVNDATTPDPNDKVYRLTGSFNLLHAFALVSTMQLSCGLYRAIARKPKGAWLASHYYWMSWSYIALFAALIAESATRILVPYLRDHYAVRSFGWFWGIVGVVMLAVFSTGQFLMKRNREILKGYSEALRSTTQAPR
jgi:flagellar hook-associated protein 1 FlgK